MKKHCRSRPAVKERGNLLTSWKKCFAHPESRTGFWSLSAAKGHLKSKDCKFTKAGVEYIDYKQTELLERFMNDQGKILPRRVTGTSARHTDGAPFAGAWIKTDFVG
ncbi:MAG: 30S ribosomal protein S18, partial [Oceanipulchritudo sp.]